RVAVPMLRPSGPPPSWHTQLDYVGLFLFYFAGTLAALVLAARCYQELRRDFRRVSSLPIAATTVLAAAPLVVDAPAVASLSLEVAFAAALVAIVVGSFDRRRDLGIQVGLPILAVPMLLHAAGAFGARFLWPENMFDGPGVALARAGAGALCLAAVASPYCFAPRPFARSVLRPRALLVALAVIACGAVLARGAYPALAKAATLAFGVELTSVQADPRLTVYLLAVATLAWTLASCAGAASPARRSVGVGLSLIVLGGYAFKWPHHYLLPLLGMALIGEAVRTVRDEELAGQPVASQTPPISDAAWSAYISLISQTLRRALGDVHSLTTRGEAGLTSSVIVGDAGGLPVRVRIERIDGAVLGLDVAVGREIDEVRGATLTMWAIPPRALGGNPAGPPAAPIFRTGDPLLDERFKVRGSALAFRRLFDDGLRARAVATLDGWLAYWENEGVRYRVYPGRGAPLDHPMPLSDLSLGRSVTAERLITVIELVIELGTRGIPPMPAGETSPEPSELS
ncbi:MAG TPA: hypothetical protein VK607_06910, partial [Kofleriaceae bacterium]|nr:hypothetical protein [Kofleriaceae bacterium]